MKTLSHEKEIAKCEKVLKELKMQNNSSNLWSKDEIQRLEKKLGKLRKKVYSKLTAWDRVAICRHPSRPQSSDYIRAITDEFVEIHGDRNFRDDPAIICGLARIGEERFVIIGQEKGTETDSRIFRNFGMVHPEGYRKALRIMRMAEKFHLPIISLIDTPGAYPGLTAEERGQGWAIAENLREMSGIQTPIIVIVIGEGCSGGALGIGIGDHIAMLEHSYYSVISPEGCASILWKDPAKNAQAAESLKMQAEDLLSFGAIDEVIKEPLGGVHKNPEECFEKVRQFILDSWENLKNIDYPDLIESRYLKFRRIGSFITKATV